MLRALPREPATAAALLAELITRPRSRHCRRRCTLLRADSPLADAFCRSGLGGAHGLALGTLPTDARFDEVIGRALPAQ